MAVPASHVAFLDLSLNGAETACAHDSGNVVVLRAALAVVELQDDWIRLAASDARMSEQVISDEKAVARSLNRRVGTCAGHVGCDILSVVLAPAIATAGPAVRAGP